MNSIPQKLVWFFFRIIMVLKMFPSTHIVNARVEPSKFITDFKTDFESCAYEVCSKLSDTLSVRFSHLRDG